MELQKFITAMIEAMGGVVIPMEYALCQVLVPEAHQAMFQGRDELLLAFDYEVAAENPQAEFVTIGSYLFEQLIAFAQKYVISTVRFADIEAPVLTGAADKIRRFLGQEGGSSQIVNDQTVHGVWAVFAFRIGYISDMKEEQYSEVWIDMSRNEICSEMARQGHLIGYRNRPNETVPLSSAAAAVPLSRALETAYLHAITVAERGKGQRIKHAELEREKKRITDYYDELHRDTMKRSERKGLSEQKKTELLDKASSIELERSKQFIEIENKYGIRIEAAPEHGCLVFVPLLEYEVAVTTKQLTKKLCLHYNPITKQFVRIPLPL